MEEEARFLADVSRSLAISIDYQATLDQAAQLTIPRLADICLVDVIEDGQLQQSVVAYADPSQAAFWGEFPEARHGPDSPALAARAYREGKPILIADVTEPIIDDHSLDAQHGAAIRRLGLTSALALPLVAHQQRLGVMILMPVELSAFQRAMRSIRAFWLEFNVVPDH